MSLRRVYLASRLRVLRPIVRLRGAVLRRVRPRARGAARPDLDATPILVLGCHRSGTSLLRRCLDSHPRICCPGETLFLESLAASLEYPDAAKGFAAVGLSLDEAASGLGELVSRWFEEHARRQGKPRWADKSPGVLAHLDGLHRLFQGRARYIAIVRDGMDVATSLGASEPRWWQLTPYLALDPDPYVAAAHYWADRNTKLRRFVTDHDQQCELIRYEDLVSAPERTLRRVLAALGEDWTPEVLDFNRHAHSSGLEDHHVSTTIRFEDNSGKHRRLPLSTQAAMWAVVRDTMIAMGYSDRSY